MVNLERTIFDFKTKQISKLHKKKFFSQIFFGTENGVLKRFSLSRNSEEEKPFQSYLIVRKTVWS